MEGKVEVTNVDMVEFVQKVYELSVPQGLGALHFQMGGLDEEIAKEIVEQSKDSFGKCVLSMDYVGGRACKMNVFKEDGKLFIRAPWYDHTEGQLKSLLEHFNIPYELEGYHSGSCNCDECRVKQGKEPQDAMGDLMKQVGVTPNPQKCKLDGMLLLVQDATIIEMSAEDMLSKTVTLPIEGFKGESDV